MDKKIEKIIASYFDQQLSIEEAKALIEWIDNGNLNVFNEYIKINYTINEIEALREESDTEFWDKIMARIDQHHSKKVISLSYWKYAAAAVIILLISLPFMLKWGGSNFNKQPEVVQQPILPGKDKAILTLENGKQIALEKGEKYATDGVYTNGENLVYNQNKTNPEKLEYNYLTIPRGGQFFVQLSDGTKVWLNSESKLKYPVSFQKNKSREVELLYGEAYFDVSESSNHNGANFIVNTKVQDLKVLGTEFNVKAYDGDNHILTTLVEGKIEISNGILNKILTPGNQSNIDIKDDKITVNKVDVAYEIAWKNGIFMFNEEPLSKIMDIMSRWYNVEVLFEDSEKKKIVFSGQLNRSDKIESLLSKIEKTGDIEFNTTNNTILVK